MEDNLKDLQATEGKLSKLVQWFEAAEESTRDARIESERSRDYYDGHQLTDEEISTLKKRKQPIVISNRIKPKVNTLKGMESKSRTNPKALPRNQGFDEEAAEAAQDSIRYVLDANQADSLFSEAFENLVIEGTEAIEVMVEPDKTRQDFKVTLRQIHWDRQFYDPHSRERTFSDARYLGEVIWLDYDQAVEMYPDAADVISVTMDKFGARAGETYNDKPQHRWVDALRKRVCLISMCYLEKGEWYHAIFVRGGFVQAPEKVPFVDEDGNSECMYVYQSAYVDRDGNRYGAVKDWLSPQDEINKRRSKLLHQMSVRQAKVRKGAVDSIAQLRNELAKPDGVFEENMENGVMILPTGDMASGQFQLLSESKAEIDSVGVNAALAGNETRSMSGRALEMRANTGSSEVQPIIDAHSRFKNAVYRAIWNRIRQYWTEEKWVRITDNENNIKFVGLNKPVTMGEKILEKLQASGEQIPPEVMQQIQSDPQMQIEVERKNNPAELDVDVILDEVQDFAALQSEQFSELAQLAQSGVPIPPEALLEASSLRNKDKIIKMIKGETEDGQSPESAKAQQEIQQLQSALQELGEKYNEIDSGNQLEERKLQIAEYEAETDRMSKLSVAMTPQDVQALVMQLMQEMLAPPQQAIQAQAMPQEMPPDPNMMQPDQAAAEAAFFMPEGLAQEPPQV